MEIVTTLTIWSSLVAFETHVEKIHCFLRTINLGRFFHRSPASRFTFSISTRKVARKLLKCSMKSPYECCRGSRQHGIIHHMRANRSSWRTSLREDTMLIKAPINLDSAEVLYACIRFLCYALENRSYI